MDAQTGIREKTAQPIKNLQDVMVKIEANCGNNGDGVTAFPREQAVVETAQHQAGNAVYDGMMYTLSEIANFAGERVEKGGLNASEYEMVARAIEPLTEVARALAVEDERIPLRKSIGIERQHEEIGDKVYVYRAAGFTLDGTTYDEVRVLIRPRQYTQSVAVRHNAGRPELALAETAQARMSLTIIPRDSALGRIHIRVDEEDLLLGYMITYDIEIGGGEENLMDRLAFPGSQVVSGAQTGQRDTHHFESQLRAGDFNTTFAAVMEAYAQKFDAFAAQQQAKPQSPQTQ